MYCLKAKEILEAVGWPADIVRAVMSHGWLVCTEVEPVSSMKEHLCVVDELTGFIIA